MLLECKDTFNLFRILPAIYIFLSNMTIAIKHDDNFDKSSLKFLASYDNREFAIGNITINQNIEISPNPTSRLLLMVLIVTVMTVIKIE